MADAVDPPVQKTILFAGTGELPAFKDGTKVLFHYQVQKCGENGTLLDDSKTWGQPVELMIGKKFKFEAWELCIKSMKNAEVAQFIIKSELCTSYPLVAKTLRDTYTKKPKEKQAPAQSHCCGGMLQGLGYEDLDVLTKQPKDLEFTIEMLKIEEPDQFKKAAWLMDETEKLAAVPTLKREGNDLFKDKEYQKACDTYAEAIGMLEQLIMKEKPQDEHWHVLQNTKMPLLLNYCQCKLFLKDFYPVIEYTTEVLDREPGNVKALYRRAKAHMEVWNPDLAKQDFLKALDLDSSLQKNINRELKTLEGLKRQKDEEDKAKLQGKMFGS